MAFDRSGWVERNRTEIKEPRYMLHEFTGAQMADIRSLDDDLDLEMFLSSLEPSSNENTMAEAKCVLAGIVARRKAG